MTFLRRSLAAFLLATLAAAPAAAADPFVTVRVPAGGAGNSAFWILDMQSRPTGNIVAGLNLAVINTRLDRTAPRWCAADVLTADSFSSSSRTVRAEIARYLRGPEGNIFRATTTMTGAPLLAVVGNVRFCDGGTAPFLLLVDRSRAAIRLAYVRTFPDWTPFIALRADGNRLIVSSCLECDHAEVLTWSGRTGRFSWRSEGP